MQKDVSLYMLGVFDGQGGARLKKTDAFIDVSANPRQQLELHNSAMTCPRERRNFVGQWKLCIVVVVPAARRLDATALKMFWRRRSRGLEKRIAFGILLARSLGLAWESELEGEEAPIKQHVEGDTIIGPPLCHANESICFTVGSASANELARGAELADTGDSIDYRRLAEHLILEPTAPLDPLSQIIQANTLELMLHSSKPQERAAGRVVVTRMRAMGTGPVARVETGYAPFEQLRDATTNICTNEAGRLDDALLFRYGDECYGDATEFWTRPLERMRLHRVARCVCGTKGALVRRVRVARLGKSRLGFICAACRRTTVASIVLMPSLAGLRQRVGAPRGAESQLTMYSQACEVPCVPLDTRPGNPGAPIAGTAAAVVRALKRGRE